MYCRYYRKYLSRKRDKFSNLEDCYRRKWFKSSYTYRYSNPPPACSRCHSRDHFTISKSCPLNPKAQDIEDVIDAEDFYSLIID